MLAATYLVFHVPYTINFLLAKILAKGSQLLCIETKISPNLISPIMWVTLQQDVGGDSFASYYVHMYARMNVSKFLLCKKFAEKFFANSRHWQNFLPVKISIYTVYPKMRISCGFQRHICWKHYFCEVSFACHNDQWLCSFLTKNISMVIDLINGAVYELLAKYTSIASDYLHSTCLLGYPPPPHYTAFLTNSWKCTSISC